MVQRVGRWLFWRTRRKLLGEYAHGTSKSTPVESLNLKSEELIEVKPLESINKTLDEAGYNRGLLFFPTWGRYAANNSVSSDGLRR